MKLILTALSIGVLICGLTCAEVSAQATAQIAGSVKDQSGAVLPAWKSLSRRRRPEPLELQSAMKPDLMFCRICAVGPYRLEAALPGFRTFVQTGIVLQVNSNPQYQCPT